MSDKQEAALVTLTVPVMMTFPNLFEAKAIGPKGKEQGKPKFSASFEFSADSPDLTLLKTTAAEVARKRWPGRAFVDKDDAQRSIKFPFTSGDRLADKAKSAGKEREWSRGKIVMAARSQYEPALSVIEGGKVVAYEGERRAMCKSAIYSGVEVLAQFNFVAYDGVGANPDGVTAYLGMVLSTKHGEKLAGGGADAKEVFKGYVGIQSNVDPTGGVGIDDEIVP